MKAPPGNDLKEYAGSWHVRINEQWRLTFKWGPTGPFDILRGVSADTALRLERYFGCDAQGWLALQAS